MSKLIAIALMGLFSLLSFTGCTGTMGANGLPTPNKALTECVEGLTEQYTGVRVSIKVPTEKGGKQFNINDVSPVPIPAPKFTEEEFVSFEPAQRERALTQYTVETLAALDNANTQLAFVENLVVTAKSEHNQTIQLQKSELPVSPQVLEGQDEPTLDELAEKVKTLL